MRSFSSTRKRKIERPPSSERSTPDGGDTSANLDASKNTAASAVQTMAEASKRSPRAQAELQLARSLNEGPRAAAQRKVAEVLLARNGSAQMMAAGDRRGLASEITQRHCLPGEEETAQAKCMGAAGIKPALEEDEDQAETSLEAEEMVQGKFARAKSEEGTDDEEYPMQAKREPVQRLNGAGAESTRRAPSTPEPQNRTGLPDDLKTGIENLSDRSLDDVKVHYNSDKPAQLNALAYTQGKDIHVGPGQQKHLAHEAWHVVQQAEGRVAPTMQMRGTAINDDSLLEREADAMGARAVQDGVSQTAKADGERDGVSSAQALLSSGAHQRNTVQRYLWIDDDQVETVPEEYVASELPEVVALLESWIEPGRDVSLGSWEQAIEEAKLELARSSPSPSASLSSPMSERGGVGLSSTSLVTSTSTQDRGGRMLEEAQVIRRRVANNNVLWERATQLITALQSAGESELESLSIDLDDLRRRASGGAERKGEARKKVASRKKQLTPFIRDAQRMVAAISEYANPAKSRREDYDAEVRSFRSRLEDTFINVYSLRGGVSKTARQELLSDLDRFASEEGSSGISIQMIKFLVQDPSILDNPPSDIAAASNVEGQEKEKMDRLGKEGREGISRSVSAAPTWASGELEIYDKRKGPEPVHRVRSLELSGNVRPIDERARYKTFPFGHGRQDKMVLHERGQEADARVVERARESLERNRKLLDNNDIYVRFTLTTEIRMCASCFLVLQQFRREFPEVTVAIRLKKQ